jgi:hypothetical protein
MQGEIGDYLFEVIVIENGQGTLTAKPVEAAALMASIVGALSSAETEPVIVIKVVPKR